MTALHAAVQSGRTDMVRYLLDHGARTDLVDWSGRTPLDVLNGVPARPAASGAGASGLAAVAPPPAAGGRGGPPAIRGGAAAPEIRTLLEPAAQKNK